MRKTVLRVPVACPKCTHERLMDLPAQAVADSLASGAPVLLFASCHRLAWKASPVEREQIQEYLEAGSGAGITDPTPT